MENTSVIFTDEKHNHHLLTEKTQRYPPRQNTPIIFSRG